MFDVVLTSKKNFVFDRCEFMYRCGRVHFIINYVNLMSRCITYNVSSNVSINTFYHCQIIPTLSEIYLVSIAVPHDPVISGSIRFILELNFKE